MNNHFDFGNSGGTAYKLHSTPHYLQRVSLTTRTEGSLFLWRRWNNQQV